MVLKLFLRPRHNISPCDPERADQPEKSVRMQDHEPYNDMMLSMEKIKSS